MAVTEYNWVFFQAIFGWCVRKREAIYKIVNKLSGSQSGLCWTDALTTGTDHFGGFNKQKILVHIGNCNEQQ